MNQAEGVERVIVRLQTEVAELVDALCSMHGAHRDRLDLCESIVSVPIRRPGGRMDTTPEIPREVISKPRELATAS